MAAAFARRFLFALLVVLLPLQGFVAAVQRVATPAHFHILVATQGVVVTGMNAGDVIETLHPHEESTQASDDGLRTHHAHPLGKVGVVYFDGDDDAAPGSGSHKHPATFDVVLPAWNRFAAPRLTALVPTAPAACFSSIDSGRVDRPPRVLLTV